MKIYHCLPEESNPTPRVASIGKFDGLHLGHAKILEELVDSARKSNLKSIVFSFDPSPVQILRPNIPYVPLTDVREKCALIERFGVDELVLFPTTREFLSLTAERFAREFLVERLHCVKLVEGENFSLGREREGRGDKLSQICRDAGIEIEVAPSVEVDGAPSSSSAIRAALLNGNASDAAKRLGRPYRLKGIVVRGDQRGRTLGFPTANLGQTTSLVPQCALYAARAILPNGETRPAAVNIGGNPTFGVDGVKIEAHILDFSGDLYGDPLALDFYAKIRDVRPFDSKESLIRQMSLDVERARSLAR